MVLSQPQRQTRGHAIGADGYWDSQCPSSLQNADPHRLGAWYEVRCICNLTYAQQHRPAWPSCRLASTSPQYPNSRQECASSMLLNEVNFQTTPNSHRECASAMSATWKDTRNLVYVLRITVQCQINGNCEYMYTEAFWAQVLPKFG